MFVIICLVKLCTFLKMYVPFWRISYMNIVYSSFHSLTLPPSFSCAPTVSQLGSLFFSYYPCTYAEFFSCCFCVHLLRDTCHGLNPWLVLFCLPWQPLIAFRSSIREWALWDFSPLMRDVNWSHHHVGLHYMMDCWDFMSIAYFPMPKTLSPSRYRDPLAFAIFLLLFMFPKLYG